jgi:hypothetical protein
MIYDDVFMILGILFFIILSILYKTFFQFQDKNDELIPSDFFNFIIYLALGSLFLVLGNYSGRFLFFLNK